MADITGTPGNDILNDTGGADNLFGLDGDDTLTASWGNDVLMGGNGNDVLDDNWGDDQLIGGEGNDQITSSHGNDVLRGDGGNDVLDDSHGDDQLFGGDGDDILTDSFGTNVLDGGTGADSMTGGSGNDTYVIDNLGDNIIETLGGIDKVQINRTVDLNFGMFAHIEQAVLTGTVAINATGNASDNSLTGNANANILTGGGGNDILTGGDGNDTLNGGAGTDTLSGGAGNDIIVVGAAADHGAGEVIDGGVGTDVLRFTSTTVGETLVLEAGVVGVEQVVISTAAGLTTGTTDLNLNASAVGTGLTLIGNAGANVLTGTSGNDILTGGAGNDTLDGGAGADRMAGGSGDDSYVIDAATDVVTEGRNAGTDVVLASVNHTLQANVENLTLTGGALNGTGNNLNNMITGTNGNNILTGLSGNDFLDGGDGADQLLGGTGNDTLDGGMGQDSVIGGLGEDRIVMLVTAGDVDAANGEAGNDTLALSGVVGGAGIVTVDLSASDQVTDIGGAAEGLLQNNFEHLDASGLGVGSSVDVTGSAGNNSLIGSDGNDTLDGGNGNDTLNGGTGDDTLVGGAGNDIYVVDSVGDVVDEVLSGTAGGVDLVQSTAATFTLGANVEHLTLLGTGDLEGIGNVLNNILTGNSGNNVLAGDAGNDTLTGNAGNDTLNGGLGVDRMAGGLGNDIYVIDSASDTMTEALNAGTDLVQATVSKVLGANVEHLTLLGSAHLNGTGNTLNNDLTGNSGNNVLTGLAGVDTLTGGDGNDTLDGGLGQDLVNGDAGDDRITMLVTANNRDTVDAGADNDTLVLSGVAPGTRAVVVDLSQADQVVSIGGVAEVFVQSNFEHLNAAGLSGFVTVTGSAGNNTLIGSSGNDSLDGGAGDDTMSGGRGNDTYTVDSVSDVVTEAPSAGIDTVFSSVDYTLSTNVENLELTGTADIDGTGNTLANILIGNSGVNVLTGGGGNDTYVVQNDTDSVVEALNAGTDSVQSAAATFTLGAHVEHLTLLGPGDIDGTGNNLNNILTGNSGDNVLTGAAGNDTLTGNAGNDTLDGGAGADRMAGGLGNDIYVVDSASDTVTEALNAGTDLVQATVSKVLGANVEHLTLLGSAHLNGTGNTLNNTLIGNSGNNRLIGMAGDDQLDGGDGDDILDGGAGIDTLVGGLGNDTYVIDNLQDTLVELAGAGTDTVQINGSVDLNVGAFTEIEHIVLSGTGAFNATGDNGDNSLTGNSAANILMGNSGNDTLNGGAGNDQLIGGLGDDVLNGGAGADSMTGGLGDDTYVIDHLGDTITESVGEGTDTVQSSISHTLGSEVENLTLLGTGTINGTGNALNNILTGNSGANVLTGGVGNDVLAGGAGNDTLNGGADDDTLHGDAGNDQLVGDTGQDTVTGGLGDDRVTMLVTSGDVDDADGEDGNDTLALSGIVGGTGVVTVDLSASDQVTIIGGVADSVLTQSNFEHLDASGLGVGGSVNVTGSAGNNNLVGSSGSDSLDGGAGNDSLDGGSGNDTLDGGSGNDRLDGGTGNDTLTGGAGNDTYVVNSTSDSITEALNGGTDVVESTASVTLSANVEHLTLLGSASLNGTGNTLDNVLTGNSGNNVLTGLAGADTLNGGDGNDTLNGGDGADTLTGGTGNDQLDGGANNDQLVGGAGNDTFIVGAGDGQDLVQDSGGADRLRFESGSAIDPIDLVISRQANDLRIAVHGTSDQITIQNWYTGAASQVETIQAANGDLLLSSQVERLIQQMATFSATSGVSWDQALDNPGLLPTVQNIIAANWQ